MSNPYRDRLLGVGVISRRSRDRVVEGKAHPDSGRPFKATTDELGNTVTEHSSAGRAPGVSDRQDVHVRPEVIKLKVGVQ